MAFLAALWLPILLSAVIVFVVSSIIHMLLPWHKSDFTKLPDEDGVMDALRKFNLSPGNYMMPLPGSMSGMKSPEFKEKMTKGPVGMLTIGKPGPPGMTRSMILWFIYCILISIFAGYITSHAVPWGTPYPSVFRFIGATAFMAYSLALMSESIWFGRKWGTTVKSMFDGLIYALLTAGTFGWLWPKM